MSKYLNFFKHIARPASGLILALLYIITAHAQPFQDGLGNSYSGAPGSHLGQAVTMHGFSDFPAGVVTSGAKASGKFSGAVYDGTYIWLIPMNAKTVVRVNPVTGAMTGYNNWPAGFNSAGEYKFRSGIYDGAGNIWLIPFAASSLVRLNTATGEMTAYSNWPDSTIADSYGKFIGGVYQNGGIYMIPYGAGGVVKFDVSNSNMTSYSGWPADFMLTGVKFAGGVLHNGSLFMIPSDSNMLVKMNLSTGAMTGYSGFPAGIGAYDMEKFFGGVPDNLGNLWLVPNSAKKLVRVNLSSGAMTGYDIPGLPADQSSKFAGGAFDGKYIWLAPMNVAALVRIDPATGSAEAFTNFPQGYNAAAPLKSAGAAFDGASLWLVPHNAGQLVRVSTAAGAELSISASGRIFAPAMVTVHAQGESVTGLKYLRLKTNAPAIKSLDDFTVKYQSANPDSKGTGQSGFTAAANGMYWVCVTFSDGTSTLKSVKIDNIYTPRLTVTGTCGDTVLYREPLAIPHGLPLEADGTLVVNPSLGYQQVSVSARPVEGYIVADGSTISILLDSVDITEIQFEYTPANTGDTPPPATKPPAKQPGTAKPEAEAPTETPTLPPVLQIPPLNPGLPTEFLPPVNNADTTDPATEPATNPDFVKTEGGYARPPAVTADPATNAKLVTYTLADISHTDSVDGYGFRIIDTPSDQLLLRHGSIPAFTGGQGLTYTILYKTDAHSAYRVLAAGVPADLAYEFDSIGRVVEISILFDRVPPGFAVGNQILYTFEILAEGYTNSYGVIWHKTQVHAPQLSQLGAVIAQLEALKASTTDPILLSGIEAQLAYATAIYGDPYATQEQIAAAIADSDSVLESNTNKPGGINLWALLPSIASCLMLILALILIIIRKRKSK